MSKKSIGTPRSATGRFTVGRTASLNISKVEGLTVTRGMRKAFTSFDEEGLSPDARRIALANKFGKKRR